MGKLLLLAVLLGAGYGAYIYYTAPQPRLAPAGVYYVVEHFSVPIEGGIRGFPPGKKVRLVHVEGSTFVVTDGEVEAQASRSKFTNDLDVLEGLMRPKEPAPAPANHGPPTATSESTDPRVEKLRRQLRETTDAKAELDRRLQVLDLRMREKGNYDGLTDLRVARRDMQVRLDRLTLEERRLREALQRKNH